MYVLNEYAADIDGMRFKYLIIYNSKNNNYVYDWKMYTLIACKCFISQ